MYKKESLYIIKIDIINLQNAFIGMRMRLHDLEKYKQLEFLRNLKSYLKIQRKCIIKTYDIWSD